MFSANWPVPKQVKTLQTTRVNGVSTAPFDSLNLGAHVGDNLADVEINRAKLSVPQPICWLNQVHGNSVLELPVTGMTLPPEADAVFSVTPNQVCAVMTADCLPVLLTDRHAQFVAAVHCGWRGLANGILTETLSKVGEKFQLDLAQVLVWLGPAIGPSQFEVGGEVRQTFVNKHPLYETCFTQKDNQKFLADIYQLAKFELELIGIQSIYSDYECTVSQKDKYFSYRRDGKTGRQASLIWLEG